jgi:Mce-associated membrane protein
VTSDTRRHRLGEEPGPARANPGARADAVRPADPVDPDRARIAVPVVPTLLVLLLLLSAATGYLWFTRPATSSVTTDDYAEVLQAARSGVVDVTSYDHLTLDDDIAQVRRITTGDLRETSIAQLAESRETITATRATVTTEVVGAAVTAADAEDATVLLVVQTTQENDGSEQAQVAQYRIQVTLRKEDGRWLLSGLTGR